MFARVSYITLYSDLYGSLSRLFLRIRIYWDSLFQMESFLALREKTHKMFRGREGRIPFGKQESGKRIVPRILGFRESLSYFGILQLLLINCILAIILYSIYMFADDLVVLMSKTNQDSLLRKSQQTVLYFSLKKKRTFQKDINNFKENAMGK